MFKREGKFLSPHLPSSYSLGKREAFLLYVFLNKSTFTSNIPKELYINIHWYLGSDLVWIHNNYIIVQ